MLNLLLIEKDVIVYKNLINTIQATDINIKHLGIALGEGEAMEIIKNSDIDIIVSNLNCISEKILEFLKSNTFNKYKKSIIVYSKKDEIPQLILDYKSLFFKVIINNRNYIYILENLKKILLYKEKSQTNLLQLINNELEYLMFNSAYKGYKFLCDCIYYKVLSKEDNIDLLNNIYPIVAKKYNTTTNNIKVGIFNVVDNVYKKCNLKKLEQYLNHKLVKKPTTQEIIESVIMHIQKIV